MNTINVNFIQLDEIYPTKLVDEANDAVKQAKSKHEEAQEGKKAELRQIVAEAANLKSTVESQDRLIKSLNEVILVKARGEMDTGHEQKLLEQAEKKLAALKADQVSQADKRAEREAFWDRNIAKASSRREEAESEQQVKTAKMQKVTQAVDAYKENPRHGIGPIPRFRTTMDALRALCWVGFVLDGDGTPKCAASSLKHVINLQGGSKVCMLPNGLMWLGAFPEYMNLPCGLTKSYLVQTGLVSVDSFTKAMLGDSVLSEKVDELAFVFIEERSMVLTRHPKATICFPPTNVSARRLDAVVDYSDIIPSIHDILEPELEFVENTYSLGSSRQSHSLLGELIDEAWEKARATIPSRPSFTAGQTRMSSSSIDSLIGRYWEAFLASPWESTIEGSYALLKHRCTRGEVANVYSLDTVGHFGFRVRTPDHDWILGEIYCPPDQFSPKEPIDPSITSNFPDAINGRWLSEIGPVKISIRTQRRQV